MLWTCSRAHPAWLDLGPVLCPRQPVRLLAYQLLLAVSPVWPASDGRAAMRLRVCLLKEHLLTRCRDAESLLHQDCFPATQLRWRLHGGSAWHCLVQRLQCRRLHARQHRSRNSAVRCLHQKHIDAAEVLQVSELMYAKDAGAYRQAASTAQLPDAAPLPAYPPASGIHSTFRACNDMLM